MKNHLPDSPPYWAKRWLHWYCPDRLLEEIEGDLLENFNLNILGDSTEKKEAE